MREEEDLIVVREHDASRSIAGRGKSSRQSATTRVGKNDRGGGDQ